MFFNIGSFDYMPAIEGRALHISDYDDYQPVLSSLYHSWLPTIAAPRHLTIQVPHDPTQQSVNGRTN